MARPTLSICIATRNRAAHLERAIRFLLIESEFPFPVEVCVSDNASIDETPQVLKRFADQGLALRYRRNETGVSMWTNHANALRFGRGAYLMNMSDDDLLDIPRLIEVINEISQDDRIVAAYAPLEYYDEVKGVGGRFSYDKSRLVEKTRLSIRNILDTIRFFVSQVVPPEVLIYRADVVTPLFNETKFCYTNLFDMCSLLLQGDVLFLRDGWYRWVAESSVQVVRTHAADVEGGAGWNNWRGGMEEMFQTLLEHTRTHLSPDGRRTLKRLLDEYELGRIMVTLGAALIARTPARAYEIYSRARYLSADLGIDPEEYDYFKSARQILPTLAPLEFLANIVKQEQSCDRLYLVGLTQADGVAMLLRNFGIEQELVRLPVDSGPADVEPGPDGVTRLVVVNARADKQAWIVGGYLPGQIIDIESVILRFPF